MRSRDYAYDPHLEVREHSPAATISSSSGTKYVPSEVLLPPWPLALPRVLSSSNPSTPFPSDVEAVAATSPIIDLNLIPSNDDGDIHIEPPTSMDEAIDV
jgi:hypothetical protein